jgi:hypothetical protein
MAGGWIRSEKEAGPAVLGLVGEAQEFALRNSV